MLDLHLLGALSDADADSYLAQVPIAEADIRARIVAAAEGLSHSLDLAVSLYEHIRHAGETPMPEDFGTTPTQVRERFLDHLPPDERRERSWRPARRACRSGCSSTWPMPFSAARAPQVDRERS